ncbi:MAG: hypothetical protein A2Z28_05635 [Chloroflexi bacterium RBG_16_51_9]|nr:MAG: hypothetical protein A2Z28_05635 [Chloroflexi bacterium RBG_16_51_9]
MEQAEVPQTQEQDKDSQEDLAHGQIVIIAFRWLIIVGALVSTLWGLGLGEPVSRQASITFILLIYAVVNFILLARYLKKSPSLAGLAYTMSLVDLIIITVVVAIQKDIFQSYVYVYYYPALMVLAVAFPTSITAAYTVGAIVVYGMMASLAGGAEFQQVFARLLMLAAVAFCGSLYRQIEHSRRAEKAKISSPGGGSVRSL